jgi:malto-oligosyltrehalose trehalohydrolase
MKHQHEMPFGVTLIPGGGARFRLWAPQAKTVALRLHAGNPAAEDIDMQSLAGGWFEFSHAHADARTRYAYVIDGDLQVCDPASRCNPDDVHGPSQITDPLAFDWHDDDWRGRPWHEAVIYELHIGCFSAAGTFSAAIEQLDDLVALGITAIELMPVADFPGRRGWGYDGVLPYAPESSYGSPDELKALVAAAHARGLMVLLDVVYNHFGPEGNYLHAYAKAFFNADVPTPWGAAINFDAEHSRTVRDFFIHNALYWIEEFHFDGLRLDAVHAMYDRSPLHFVDELAQAVHNGPGKQRQVHLVLESDLNDATRLPHDASGRPTHATAQWNDDVHHTLHVLATGETDGYYIDYAESPVRLFGRALAEGFAYQGDASVFRDGELRGTPSDHLPPLAFVNSLQTHDQVGNRAFGERIAPLADEAGRSDALRALTACVLLAPSPPMLFMGEEFAASTPFLYFCDFEGELAAAVTAGRRNEFGRFARFADESVRSRIPDPNAPATFERSKLDWSERIRGQHAHWLALYSGLLRVRQAELMPWLAGAASGRFTVSPEGTLHIDWPLAAGRHSRLYAQLANTTGAAVTPAAGDTCVYASSPISADQPIPAWSVQVWMHSP